VTGFPVAHVGGVPVEEMLGAFGPALLLAAGAAFARLSASFHNINEEVRHADVRRNRQAST